MKNPHTLIVPNFYDQASLLRSEFDLRFQNPHDVKQNRFIWDYWHVQDQYTLLRTPGYVFFKQKIYMDWHKNLVLWGRRTLGCWDISPPWMSCYIEGCKQELHADVPHGPWAFVYSLSPKKPKYTGGETLILKEQTLSYWKNFGSSEGREISSFIDRIPARFNQLTCFAPRGRLSIKNIKRSHIKEKYRPDQAK